MGLIRKSMSVSTAGLIDFRSDKERIARSTRKTHKAVKSQTRLTKKIGKESAQQQSMIAGQQAAAARTQAQLSQNQVNLAAAQLTVAQHGPTPQVIPAGWYVNPAGSPLVMQWWDGYAWTEQRQPAPLPPGR